MKISYRKLEVANFHGVAKKKLRHCSNELEIRNPKKHSRIDNRDTDLKKLPYIQEYVEEK